jgi:linoleoyl-CoA desaturase
VLQPVWNAVNALLFEYGIAAYDLEIGKVLKGRVDKQSFRRRSRAVLRKIGKQVLRDYVLHPLLSGPSALPTLAANVTANLVRNVWSHSVIMCGHFPSGVETFTKSSIDGESRGEWYLRQMLGAANISGGPATHLMTGNLSFQIEHHLYPDLPSNRYAEISVKVRKIADEYGIPYTTGPLYKQYGQVLRTVWKLALPNKVWGWDPPGPKERKDQEGDGHPLLATKEGLQANPDGNLNAEPAEHPDSAKEAGAA